MKDNLVDLVKHTHSLGNINIIKVKGTDSETEFEGLSEDRSVIFKGKFKTPVAEFNTTFGIPSIAKLNILLNIPVYAEDADISLTKKDDTPTGLRFQNSSGDFKNDYRFMAEDLINDKLKSVKFRGVNWNVDFEPSVASIMRLKYQAQAHSEENFFTAKTEGSDLKFYFGDHSSHAGDFVFQADVGGTLNKAWKWPVAQVQAILALDGDKTFKISDDGAAMITVDSGIAEYEYILPAMTK
jgi:hypothetical protein